MLKFGEQLSHHEFFSNTFKKVFISLGSSDGREKASLRKNRLWHQFEKNAIESFEFLCSWVQIYMRLVLLTCVTKNQFIIFPDTNIINYSFRMKMFTLLKFMYVEICSWVILFNPKLKIEALNDIQSSKSKEHYHYKGEESTKIFRI